MINEKMKEKLSQIDENSISANNAIFSSITDRLTLFEEDFFKVSTEKGSGVSPVYNCDLSDVYDDPAYSFLMDLLYHLFFVVYIFSNH